MEISKRDSFMLVLTIVVIEFISGYLHGFYEPLLPKFASSLNVDASKAWHLKICCVPDTAEHPLPTYPFMVAQQFVLRS